MARRVTSKDKWKSKVWYEILAPQIFGEKVVGETPASDPDLVRGRRVEVIASNLTGSARQNNMKLFLEIEQVAGKKAKTRVIGFELMRGYLRSIVQRRRTKVEGIFDTETKDGVKIRVKCVAITFRNCHTEQEKAIRALMREYIESNFKNHEFGELLNMVLERQVQEEIKNRARKIMPLTAMEIRKIEIL